MQHTLPYNYLRIYKSLKNCQLFADIAVTKPLRTLHKKCLSILHSVCSFRQFFFFFTSHFCIRLSMLSSRSSSPIDFADPRRNDY